MKTRFLILPALALLLLSLPSCSRLKRSMQGEHEEAVPMSEVPEHIRHHRRG